jgi:prophage maintenance system killer protein
MKTCEFSAHASPTRIGPADTKRTSRSRSSSRRSIAPRSTVSASKAATLIAHLAQNHPLPDGNKRAAFLQTARFLHANGHTWGGQDTNLDASMVERIAASDAAHDEIVAWIRARTDS